MPCSIGADGRTVLGPAGEPVEPGTVFQANYGHGVVEGQIDTFGDARVSVWRCTTPSVVNLPRPRVLPDRLDAIREELDFLIDRSATVATTTLVADYNVGGVESVDLLGPITIDRAVAAGALVNCAYIDGQWYIVPGSVQD